MLHFAEKIWNSLGAGLRRQLIWLASPKFIHGVSGVVLDNQGRVLLLKHRFWKQQRWGMPSGLAHHGETPAETLRRELREETGLDARVTKLLRVTTRGRLTEFLMLAECTGTPEVRSVEVLEARFCERGDLPVDLLATHREALDWVRAGGGNAGLDI